MTGSNTIAREYIGFGWMPIPVAYRDKFPVDEQGKNWKDWDEHDIDLNNVDTLFNASPRNVGVRLGPKSSNLVDVDLDCPLARALARHLLPATGAIFGRKASPESHWLYTVDHCGDGAAKQFKFKPIGTIVELRSGGGDKGAQSVFPGSTHKTGELIDWSTPCPPRPAVVLYDDLLKAVTKIAIGSVIAHLWPPITMRCRHNAALCVGGVLARAGWGEETIERFVEAVARAAGDTDARDQARTARDSAKSLAAGDTNVFGLPTFTEIFGDDAAKFVARRLDLRAGVRCGEGGEDRIVQPPTNPMPNVRTFLASEYAHPDGVLLIQQGGQFYRWDGTCWPVIEDPFLRAKLYGFFETKAYRDGDKLKPFSPTQRKIADLFDALKAITIIPTTTTSPGWVSNPAEHPADQYVACLNGLVHWPTRTMIDHRPGYYTHYSVPFAFDPKAPQPDLWLAFLRELWGDDQESIDALQEWFGYLLSGDTRQQKMLMLIGPKRGGKGTIVRVLRRTLGQHNVAGPTLASLGTNFGLQGLIGKPVAVISDARMGGRSDSSVITERLLSISGEDQLDIDRKYLEPWSGQLPTRIVVLSNMLPRFTDASGALASRFIVLRLQQSFYGRENPNLTEELCQELPGIFNWALDGLERLRARRKFLQPEAGREAIQQLEDLASPVGAFVRDCCVVRPDKLVPVDELYSAYRRWCLNGGRIPPTKETFGRDLKALCPELKRRQMGATLTPTHAGIALKSGDEKSDSRDSLVSQHCSTHAAKYPSGPSTGQQTQDQCQQYNADSLVSPVSPPGDQRAPRNETSELSIVSTVDRHCSTHAAKSTPKPPSTAGEGAEEPSKVVPLMSAVQCLSTVDTMDSGRGKSKKTADAQAKTLVSEDDQDTSEPEWDDPFAHVDAVGSVGLMRRAQPRPRVQTIGRTKK